MPRRRTESGNELLDLLEVLEAQHGAPPRPVPKTALDWVLWENVAYLVSDERRLEAYRAWKRACGLTPAGILALTPDEMLELSALGGMHATQRVRKLTGIAELVESEFGGDLGTVLGLPVSKARAALKRFPGIGAPGADKILLFTKTAAVPALESNGLRSLTRLGHVDEAKSYSTTYRHAVRWLADRADDDARTLIRAFGLLRVHGQTLCKNNAPDCDACPLVDSCPSAE